MAKAGEDFIRIQFPDFIRKERMEIPIGNINYPTKDIIRMIYNQIYKELKNLGIE